MRYRTNVGPLSSESTKIGGLFTELCSKLGEVPDKLPFRKLARYRRLS
jgi:hypothetical protein